LRSTYLATALLSPRTRGFLGAPVFRPPEANRPIDDRWQSTDTV